MMALLRRLHYYLRRRQFEAELDEEMRHHLAMSSQKQFGNVTLLKEDSRAMWTWTFWEQLMQDLRYAFRTMNSNRVFTALAVLSLALGIGANTAIFSFMDSILLRSLPVANPEPLVMLNWHEKPRGARTKGAKSPPSVMYGGLGTSNYNDPKSGSVMTILPYPAFEFFQKDDSIFSTVFADCIAGDLNLTIQGQADIANGEYVSGDYFRGLGVPPAAGRLVIPDDDRAGAPAIAVVSLAFSQRRLGGAANAVGQAILVNNVPFTVVGVTPQEFFGVDPRANPDVYLPMHASLLLDNPLIPPDWYLAKNMYWVEVMARLRPGVSLAQAQATLAEPFHQWVESTANTEQQRANLPALVLRDGAGGLNALRQQYSRPLYVLMTLVGLILAIACANVANLLLARATARRREMALRLSVGASRPRTIRQLLTESVVLASLGGVLGVFFATWGMRVLTLLLAAGQANFTLRATLNWHVLSLATGLSVLTGILFGLAPAIQSTRVDVISALKETRSSQALSVAGFSLSQALVVCQIALSLLILVAAGLFVRTLSNLESVQLGFNRENILLFQLNAGQAGHRGPEMASFYGGLQKQFRAMPGVRNASLSSLTLIGVGNRFTRIEISGAPATGNHVLPVGPGFLATMQTPILLGREIDERDQPGSPPVAVVSELFAKANFGGENPLGRHLSMGGPTPRDVEIVGVSENVRYGFVNDDVQPVVFVPYIQGILGNENPMTYALRTVVDPLTLANTVREIVHQADSRVPVTNLKTQRAQIDQSINQEIVFAKLCSAFAMLALVIACVGLYGTISYNVARRTGEIGIRMALGAQRGGVVRMILRQVVVLAALGLAIGLPTALATSKLVKSFLYRTKPDDPVTLALAAATLLCAALLAGYAPARRASRIDPMTALRND